MADKENNNNPYSDYKRSKNIDRFSRVSRRTAVQSDREYERDVKIRGVHGNLDADNTYQKVFNDAYEATTNKPTTYQHEEVGNTIIDNTHNDAPVKTGSNKYSESFSFSNNSELHNNQYNNEPVSAYQNPSDVPYSSNAEDYRNNSINSTEPHKVDSYNHAEYNNNNSQYNVKTNTYDNNTQNIESLYENKPSTYKNTDNLQESSYNSAINNEYSSFDYKTETASNPESRIETFSDASYNGNQEYSINLADESNLNRLATSTSEQRATISENTKIPSYNNEVRPAESVINDFGTNVKNDARAEVPIDNLNTTVSTSIEGKTEYNQHNPVNNNVLNPTTHADAEALKIAQQGVDESVTGGPSTSINIEQGNNTNSHGIKTSDNQNNEQFSQLSLFGTELENTDTINKTNFENNNYVPQTLSGENVNINSNSLNTDTKTEKINTEKIQNIEYSAGTLATAVNQQKTSSMPVDKGLNSTNKQSQNINVQEGHPSSLNTSVQTAQTIQQQMNFKNGNIVDKGMSFETNVDASTKVIGGVTVTGEKTLKTSNVDSTLLAPTILMKDEVGNEVTMNVGETIMLSNGVMLEYNLNEAGEGVLYSNFIENKNITGKENKIKGTDTNLAGQWTTQTNVDGMNNIKVSFSQDENGDPVFILNLSDEQKETVKTLATANDKATSSGSLTAGNNDIKTTSKNSITSEDVKSAKTKKNIEKGATVLVRGATLVIGSLSTILEGAGFAGPEAQFGAQKFENISKKGAKTSGRALYNSKLGRKVRTVVNNKTKHVVVNIGRGFMQTSYGNSLSIAKNTIQNKILNSRLYQKLFNKNGIGTKAGNILGKIFGKSGILSKFFNAVKVLKNTIRKYLIMAAGAFTAIVMICMCASLVISSIESTLFFWVDDRTQFEKMIDYIEDVNKSVDTLKNGWTNNGKIPEKGSKVSGSLQSITSNSAENVSSFSEEGGHYQNGNISFDESGLTSFQFEGADKVSVNTGIKSSDGNYISGETGNYSSSDHNSDYSTMYINVSKLPSNYFGNINGINWKAFWVLVQVYEVDTEDENIDENQDEMDKVFDTTRKNPYGNFKDSWEKTGATAEYSVRRWVTSNISAEINYTLYANANGGEVDASKFTEWKSNLIKYNEGQVINAKKNEYEGKINEVYNRYINLGDSLYDTFVGTVGQNRGGIAYVYGYSSTNSMKSTLNKYFKQYSTITDKQYRKKLGLSSGVKADITPSVYASKMVNKVAKKKSVQEFMETIKSRYEPGALNGWCEDLALRGVYGELYNASAMQKLANYNSLINKNPNKSENRIYPAYRVDYTLTDDGDQTLENYKDFMKNQYYETKVQKDSDGNPIKNANGEVQKTYEAQPLDESQNEMAENLYFNEDTAFEAFPDDLQEKIKSYCNINLFEHLAMSSGGYPASSEEQIKYVAALQVVLNKDTFNVTPGQPGYMYPGVTIAQAMQESGIGTTKVSDLAIYASNLFGMKHTKTGWGGMVIGSYHGSTAEWAQFENWGTCIQGRQDTIIKRSGYSGIKNATSASAQLTALSQSDWCEGGYSTLNKLYNTYGKAYDNLSYDEAKQFIDNNKGSTSNIIALAQTKIGCRYVYGASHSVADISNSNTTVFDCSSFVSWAYYQTGNQLPGGIMTSSEIAKLGSQPGWQQISIDQAQPGDILWKSGHVGLYAGNGQTVEAKGAKWGVCMDKASRFTYAIRKVN